MKERTHSLSYSTTAKAIIGAVLAVLLCLTMTPTAAYAAPTSAEKQAEAQAVLQSLNAMQDTLNKASDDYFTAVSEQEQAQAGMDEAQKRIDEASGKITDLQGKLGNRANNMYREGNISVIDLLLGANTFEEFVNNWDFLTRMNQNDADLVKETKDLRAEVEDQKAEYTRQEAIAAEKAVSAKAIKEEAEATAATMQETYDSLSAEAAELLEQERAAEEAAAAARAAAVVAAAAETAPSNNNGGDNSDNGSSGGGNYTPEPSYDVSTGNAVVDRAYSWVGRAEYVWGGCSPGAFDCSGFVSYCLTGAYSRLGTTYTFLGWPRVSDPQPGDVAVNSGHTGIYIGGGQMIHAATYGVGVVVGPVQSGMVFVRY